MLKNFNKSWAAGTTFSMDAEADNIFLGLEVRLRYGFPPRQRYLFDISAGILRPVESGHFNTDRLGFSGRAALSLRDQISIFGTVDVIPTRGNNELICPCESSQAESILWSAGIQLGSVAGLVTAIGVPAVILAMILMDPPS